MCVLLPVPKPQVCLFIRACVRACDKLPRLDIAHMRYGHALLDAHDTLARRAHGGRYRTLDTPRTLLHGTPSAISFSRAGCE